MLDLCIELSLIPNLGIERGLGEGGQHEHEPGSTETSFIANIKPLDPNSIGVKCSILVFFFGGGMMVKYTISLFCLFNA